LYFSCTQETTLIIFAAAAAALGACIYVMQCEGPHRVQHDCSSRGAGADFTWQNFAGEWAAGQHSLLAPAAKDFLQPIPWEHQYQQQQRMTSGSESLLTSVQQLVLMMSMCIRVHSLLLVCAYTCRC
jgi:hypothetical protein